MTQKEDINTLGMAQDLMLTLSLSIVQEGMGDTAMYYGSVEDAAAAMLKHGVITQDLAHAYLDAFAGESTDFFSDSAQVALIGQQFGLDPDIMCENDIYDLTATMLAAILLEDEEFMDRMWAQYTEYLDEHPEEAIDLELTGNHLNGQGVMKSLPLDICRN